MATMGVMKMAFQSMFGVLYKFTIPSGMQTDIAITNGMQTNFTITNGMQTGDDNDGWLVKRQKLTN